MDVPVSALPSSTRDRLALEFVVSPLLTNPILYNSWAVTAVRGTHYCLRKVDYPLIWRLLKEERITHFNAAPTVNTLLCAAAEAERLPEPVRITVAASPPTAHLFEQMVSDLGSVPILSCSTIVPSTFISPMNLSSIGGHYANLGLNCRGRRT